MGLDKPIFIIGTGRCGSTIFHQIFCQHPQVAFLSGLCQLYPGRPHYNTWAMRLMDTPGLRHWARRKFRPAEHWAFWDHYSRGFSIPFRDLLSEDVRPNEKKKLRRVLEQMTTPRRHRPLVKLTGWPRIGFLSEIFPDALFIHMVRDGRAVTNSLLNTDFWQGWGGPDHWQWGPLTAEQQAEWEASGRSFVVLAALQWRILMEAYEKAKQQVPATQYLEIKYEDFAANPSGVFDDILEFCQLDYPQAFRKTIERSKVESANYKWREYLTGPQQELLEDCLRDSLMHYGYADQAPVAARLRSGV